MEKTLVLEDLAGCVRERTRYQKRIKHAIKINSKINAKFMFEKMIPKTQNIIKNGAEKEAKIHEECIKKGLRTHNQKTRNAV